MAWPISVHPLDDPRVKLDWAKSRFRDMNAQIDRVRREAEGHGVKVDYDADLGFHVVYGWLPDRRRLADLSLMLGDVVHSARGALDFVAWKLATKHLGRMPTEKEARRIQFPITPDPNNFAGSSVLGFIPLGADAVMAKHQPFPNNPRSDLAVLHWLSNRDKHRLVLPALTSLEFADQRVYRFTPKLPTDARVRRNMPDFLLPNGASDHPKIWFKGNRRFPIAEHIHIPVTNPGDYTIEIETQAPLDVVFGGPSGNLHMKELEAMIECVQVVVGDFDRFF